MMILNIGCGTYNPVGYGTYYKGHFRYKKIPNCINIDINIPDFKIENFIQCDANYLPFRDKVFDTAIASHIIEHILTWQRALKEWKRVCNKLILRYPHFLNPFAYHKSHIWVFIEKQAIPVVYPLKLISRAFCIFYPVDKNRKITDTFFIRVVEIRREITCN